MECTQRLECTQDFNAESFSQRSGPDQIGFLGICGQTYPVNLGPNKIGRDPQTCNIVLDMKSLSRQHAVINVLNKKEYMLMDLGSVNKTKLGVKTLQAYIPYPLKNGDTVQFGDVFGMFRLIEDETDLPMTQQCDVPDTPVFTNHVVKSVLKTLIPESPDVSDKDESFVAPSQPPKEPEFKTPKTHFIKTSGKTILRPAIGSNKIDNIYWNSSQKSPLLRLDESDNSLNDTSSSANTVKTVVSNINGSGDVHEMDTQVPSGHNDSTDSIYSASTQLPPQTTSPSIHSLQTQIPVENLPSVHEVDEIEMQFELSMSSKNNTVHNAQTQAFDINEAETQAFDVKAVSSIHELNTQFVPNSVHNHNTQVTNAIHSAHTQTAAEDLDDEDIPLTGDFTKTLENAAADEKTSESDEDILEVFEDIDEAVFSPKKNTAVEDPLIKIQKNLSKPSPSGDASNNIKEVMKESDEEINFDEIDGQGYETFESQPILLPDVSPTASASDKENREPASVLREENSRSPIVGIKKSKMRLDSDSSTDCDDIAMLPTQNIVTNKQPDIDDTICELGDNTENKAHKDIYKKVEVNFDEMATQMIEEDLPKSSPIIQMVNMNKNKKLREVTINKSVLSRELSKMSPSQQVSSTEKNIQNVEPSFDEMATQILEEDLPKVPSSKDDVDFEDMPTQIINEEDLKDCSEPPCSDANKSNDVAFEEMATQLIEDDVAKSEAVFSEEIVSPFKVPFISPIKIKRKDLAKLATPKIVLKQPSVEQKDENYYAATQEIVEDLCTQEALENARKTHPKDDSEIVLCSDEEFEIPDRFRHIEVVSPKKKISKRLIVADCSQGDNDGEEKVNEYLAGLTDQQIRDVVGLNDSVAQLSKKSSSDLSDVECTPKKVHPFKFMNVLLPDSQEIKVGVTSGFRIDKIESSESETEADSQENTPILFKRKDRIKKEAKVDLVKKFDADALPTRVIGRVRKPPAKLLHNIESEPTHTKILKPNFLTEQEDCIDTEIITENIMRLKNTNKKKEESRDTNKKVDKCNAIKNDLSPELSIENKFTSKKETRANVVDKKTGKAKNIKDNNDQTADVSKRDIHGKTKSTEKVSEEPQRRSIRKGGENDPKTSRDKPKDTKLSDNTAESHEGRRTRAKDTKRKSNEKKNDKSTNTKPPSLTKGILKNNTIEEIVNQESDQENLNPSARPVRSTRRRKPEKQLSEPPAKAPEEVQSRPPSRRGKKSHTPRPEDQDQIRRSKRQKNTNSQNNSQTKTKPNPTKTKPTKTIDSQNDYQSKITSFMKESNHSDSQNNSQARTSSRRKQNLSDINQDQSTVYNISGESNIDTPKGLKRTAPDVKGPSAKRSRSANVNASANVSQRATPAKSNKVQRVLFTAFPNEEVKSILEKLGAVIVSDATACDVLVTMQIKRTFKLLCVVGLGKPIVGPDWVQACADSKTIVDPWQYLIRDSAAEQRFKFSLQRTLSGRRHYLAGCHISSTPAVMPSAPEMKLIVESSGGVWKEGGANWICVSTERDKGLWPALKKKGATVVSTEFILAGVLRQVLDVEGNKLG